MEISTAVKWSTAQPAPADSYDLDTTILHELGHALGLSHSTVTTAVMFPSLATGTSKRVLDPDDIAGIRALYGTAATPTPTAIPSVTVTPLPQQGDIDVYPNGEYQAGVNAVVIQGSGSAAMVVTKARTASGREVQAVWLLRGGLWLFYLPAAPQVDGGLGSGFPGPFANAFVILG